MNPPPADGLPVARVQRRRRFSLLWLLPLLAVLAAAGLVYAALGQRGVPIAITFQQGHGLKAGDVLRYRGIAVGSVREIRLTPDLDGIAVRLSLDRRARNLARAGSRFWIVRPQVSLSGASGLETLIGAHYLSVLPGEGELQDTFTGLEEPPLLELLENGGLEVLLTTPVKGNLRAGAPVNYRQVPVGTILSVGLARDASGVEVRIYVEPQYTTLIRDNTRFWKTGGARFSAGITGLSVDVDSVPGLLLGGVNLALPPDPGRRVEPGQRFRLYEEPGAGWTEWVPALSLADGVAGPAADRPRPLRAVLRWEQKNLLYLTGEKQRQGWVLAVEGGFLGPADLLAPPADALPGSARLSIDQRPVPLAAAADWGEPLLMLPYAHGYPPWSRWREVTTAEDTLIVADPARPARFVGADRYRRRDGYWRVDPPAPFDARWHGAAVVAESDGALLGLLWVGENETAVFPVRPPDQ
ncbi:MAG: MlaD family protein [Pseudomonadota bacterium]|nr:MlaD family protein [Pseudomonadota bacterium]